MTTINSPLGKRNINSGMKQIEIDDLSDFDNEVLSEDKMQLEREMAQQRMLKAKGKERLPEVSKNRIEMFLGIFQKTTSVTIENVEFVLRTLKSSEQRELLKASMPFDGTIEFGLEVRRNAVARSLVSINGKTMDLFLLGDTLEKRLALVDEMEYIVQSKLYDAFTVLVDETKKSLYITDDVMEEVADDLKK